jgi:hypothetical protein
MLYSNQLRQEISEFDRDFFPSVWRATDQPRGFRLKKNATVLKFYHLSVKINKIYLFYWFSDELLSIYF